MSRSLGLLVFAPLIALAAEGTTDKSGYQLFHPTPREQMRDFTTDRPSKSDTPTTVDAGHFQIESDIARYKRDRQDDIKTEEYGVSETNLKAGLTNSIDFQLLLESYLNQSVANEANSQKLRGSGFGDVTTRLKWNLIGNDEGDMALGLIPYARFPTHSRELQASDRVTAGLSVPIELQLPADQTLGTMFTYNRAPNDGAEGYHSELESAITLTRKFGALEPYVELWNRSSDEAGAYWPTTFDVGLTYRIGRDLQLDVGANLGLNDAADDIETFAGVSFRY